MHFAANLIMWVTCIFDKPTLSTHDPYYQWTNLVYQRPMSHFFDKPTLSVDKPGLLNLMNDVTQYNKPTLLADDVGYVPDKSVLYY